MTKPRCLFLAAICLLSSGLVLAEPTDILDQEFASRGEGVLTHREFDARMSKIPKKDHATFLRDGSRLERITADLLIQKQMVAEAEAAGFHNDPDIRARMELAAMAELAAAWVDHYVASTPPADLEVLAYENYLLNEDDFVAEETRDVSHILISLDERGEDAARVRAGEVMAKLSADPSSFPDMVSQYTEDNASAAKKGLYTGVKRGDMVPEFDRVAFMLEPGEISEPVLTRYGFHIIRLEGINEPRKYSFEDVKARLMDNQRIQHEKRIRIDYLNRFTSMDTNLTKEAVRTMLLRYVDEDMLTDIEDGDSE